MRAWMRGSLVAATMMSSVSARGEPVPRNVADYSYQPYAKPQILANVGGGREINLFCMGRGSPAVIMTAAAGEWSATWRKVQREVSRTTRVCAWDRAGFGFSSPSPQRQDVAHTELDLETALNAAKLTGPYVLVGHSLGSYETLLFADRHPRAVAGMMLEEPSFPDQFDLLKRRFPNFNQAMHASDAQDEATAVKCITGLRDGSLEPSDEKFSDCTNDDASYPADLKARLAVLNKVPGRLLTQKSYSDEALEDAKEVINPNRNYRDLPLIVLTATDLPAAMPPAFSSAAVRSEMIEFQTKAWPQAHSGLAALSGRGRDKLVSGSSHYIHLLKPQVVIAVIDQIVGEARSHVAQPRRAFH